MKKILFLSNGHGEDLIAAKIIDEINTINPNLECVGYPLVGEGFAYQNKNIPIAGLQKIMPSGGFVNKSFTSLLRDLKQGLLGLTISQIARMRKIRKDIDEVVVIGDIYPLILASFFLKSPVIFMPTAISKYIRNFFALEKWFLKKHCSLILARDHKTSEYLLKNNLPAACLGNVMMDLIDNNIQDLGLAKENKVITFLPGSRQEAFKNIERFVPIADQIAKDNAGKYTFTFLLSLSPNLDFKKLLDEITYPIEKLDIGNFWGKIKSNKAELFLVNGHFSTLLNDADIVIGLAGTANEQAVGKGKPVIAWPGSVQYNSKYAHDQRRLLGKALNLLTYDPKAISKRVFNILDDEDYLQLVKQIGQERMGQVGAAKAIAKKISELTSEKN